GLLTYRGDYDEVIDHERALSQISSLGSTFGPRLADSLLQRGDRAAAITAYRDSLKELPTNALLHCKLGLALEEAGRLSEALGELRRGHEMGVRQSGWTAPSGRWVERCARLRELEGRLPAFLSGELAPANASERADLGWLCHFKARHGAAVRFF